MLAAAALLGGGLALAVEVGQAAPPFALPSVQEGGAPIRLADYRGKVVYLDFWSSWCAPCRRAMPELAKLHSQWPQEKFAVLALNLDTRRRDALRFLEQVPVGYPNALDVGGVTARRYGVVALPAAFVIDGAGQVRHVLKGRDAEDFALIREILAGLASGG